MLKGLLKMSMLKIISENKTTGYQIIKHIQDLTGEKPSTGSIYPLLKNMQTHGWITGTNQNGKTTYEIAPTGQAILHAHGNLKDYYEQKLNSSITLLHGTFDQNPTSPQATTLVSPVINQVSSLLVHGISPKKIEPILNKTVTELYSLLEE
jgi:DNA-binding PadR family transcriptional regulator